jgi:hypothetical protein
MAALSVTLEAIKREQVAPGEAAFVATVTNAGDRPASFHRYQAEHGSLVLQIVDPSGRRVLPPPPPPPGELDLAPATTLAPAESITFRYAGFLGGQREPGRYRVRWYATDLAPGAQRSVRFRGFMTGAPAGRYRARFRYRQASSPWVELEVRPRE